MNIKDIAKLAGVSTSTISKVLNNKDDDISEETRKKVLGIIKEYQYVPFSKVRQNLPLKSHLLGLLITKQFPGIQELISGAESEAAASGYSLIVCNTKGEETKVKKYLSVLLSKNVEGILLAGIDDGNAEETVVPIVGINIGKSSKEFSYPYLYYSMEDAGELAVQQLVARGHQKIGCLLLKEEAAVEKGYTKALHSYNIPIDPMRIYRAQDMKEIETVGAASCQKMDITALVCGNTQIAYYVCRILKERGVIIPNELSLISTRDDTIAKVVENGISAVSLPDYECGSKAVQILIDEIETKKYEHSHTKLPVKFQERNSIVTPPVNRQGEKLVVVGSMNVDVTISVPIIPTDGETIMATGVSLIPGGKGANQAVGAGKLGGLVYMIGRLGNDSDGKDIYNSLIKSNVKTEGIIFDSSLSSGKAYINVAGDGESNIVVYSGANQNLDKNQIKQFSYLFQQARYCLLSLEIPEDTAQYVINTCKKQKLDIILKPSGVKELKKEFLENLTYFIPNEKELGQLIPEEISMEEKAQRLLESGVKNVIVTRGKKGCYLKNADLEKYFPAANFMAVDTTGGADAFISALAVYLSEGNDILHAIGFATYAAGICITRAGVQPALPDRIALDVYQDDINLFTE